MNENEAKKEFIDGILSDHQRNRLETWPQMKYLYDLYLSGEITVDEIYPEIREEGV